MVHPIPLMVRDNGTLRQATEDELLSYAAAHKTSYSKWVVANRIAYAKNLLATDVPHNEAWTAAFAVYPADEARKTKPRFVMNI